MSAATAKYGILVGVDGSAQSNAAVAWAAREAVMRQLPITLLHIVAPVVVGWPVGQLYANMTEWQKDNAQQVIEQAREALTNSLGESKPPQVHTELVFSNVVPTLIDASQQAWLMVVGSQGMGALGRLLLGSISTALLHHARCPVAIIHSGNGATPDSDAPVLVGIDGSPASEAATAPCWQNNPTTKPPAEGWTWWRCTPGPIWGCFRFWGWIGESARRERLRSSLNASPAGKSSIRMSACTDRWCATSPLGGCSSILSKLSWWWSAAMGAGGFPACCWVR